MRFFFSPTEIRQVNSNFSAPASRGRLVFVGAMCALGFMVIGLRLAGITAFGAVGGQHASTGETMRIARPDLTDRNGNILAKDLAAASLYADSRKIIDVDEAVEKLGAILTESNQDDLRRKLSRKRAFIWLKRGMSPRQQSAVHQLGLPGLGFVRESRRVYPNGRIASHILGHVDIDNRGLAGIEKYVDEHILKKSGHLKPVALSIDMRAQYAMREELISAMELYKAKAAAGVVLDVHTGEVMAMSSLPDYDPAAPAEALKKENLNRMTAGIYELGSVFKAFTVGMALDEKVVTLQSGYDASSAIVQASFRIDDFHAKRRYLTVPEIFIYSSNIGAAKMAIDTGAKRQKAFLRKMGLLDRLKTELPESRVPQYPKIWRPVNTMTISYGHGLAVSPLQAASAAAALVNGGKLITPTFLMRSEAAAMLMAKQVLDTETSKKMRYLMRLNVTDGTAKKADVPGYRVGGKTGTAEKAGKYGYNKNKLLTSFLATFPSDAPRYLVFVMLDEPKGIKQTHGYATSGWNAAPVSGKIIRRLAPMLGVVPEGVRAEIFPRPVLAAYNHDTR